jgi:MGT family glycosyltransferase
MHLFFVSIAGAGHVNSTLPLARELVNRGHHVTFATDEKLRPAVEAAGATLLPLPTLGLPDLATATGPGAGLVELMRLQIQTIRDGILEKHLDQARPDAVCYDSMTQSGRVTADKLGIPAIALNPSYATNEHFSMRSLAAQNPSAMPAGQIQIFQRLRDMAAEFAAERGGRPLQLLGAPPADLNIVFIPRQFQYEGATFDDRFHFVGPSLGNRDADTDWQPPTTNKPLLFISLGTTPFNNNADFFRKCIQAFTEGPWQVAIAIGSQTSPADLGPIPDNIEVRAFFPQLAVLSHADVFLSHTGMNSTMEALYYGVPIVAVPQQPEQQANARRVDQLGLGRHLSTDITPEVLRYAVEEVHADTEIRENLTQMSTIVRNSGGAPAAADAIEHHLTGRALP